MSGEASRLRAPPPDLCDAAATLDASPRDADIVEAAYYFASDLSAGGAGDILNIEADKATASARRRP